MVDIGTPDRRSRQMDVTSPRRLDALRSNGNNILGGTTNDLDAASVFKRTQQMGFGRNADQASNAGNGPVRAQMNITDMID